MRGLVAIVGNLSGCLIIFVVNSGIGQFVEGLKVFFPGRDIILVDIVAGRGGNVRFMLVCF